MRILWLILTLVPAFADDWPRFHGPNGAGTSESSGLPAEFGPKKNRLWRTELPFSHSSPVVAGGHVYVTAVDGDKLLLLSLDAKTGRIEWRRETPRRNKMEIYRANDAATPSPAADGKNVYVFYPEMGLISYGVDGNERWRLPLGPFKAFYGLAASPVVEGGTVLIQCDSRPKPFLAAVDAATGKLKWRAERPEVRYDGYSTPILYRPQDGPAQVIALGPNRVDGYSLATGEKLWWVSGLAYYPIASPVIVKEMLIVNTWGADQPMGPTWAEILKHDKNKDGKIARTELPEKDEMRDMFGNFDLNDDGFMDKAEFDFSNQGSLGMYGAVGIRLGGRGDLTKTGIAWHNKKDYGNNVTPVVYRDVMYFAKGGGILGSFDPLAGKALKIGRAPSALEEHWASPVAADGKVYFVNNAGKVIVLKAGAQWEILAVSELGEEVFATPAIAGNRIFIRTDKSLQCFGL